MKILYISVKGGGSYKALINMLDGLSFYNIDPIVVLDKSSDLKSELIERNIKQINLDYRSSFWPRISSWKDIIKYPWRVISIPLKNYFAVLKLVKIVKKNKIDIIHTNVGVINIGHKAAIKCNVPHVWHLREYQDLDFHIRQFPTKGSFLKNLEHSNNYSVAITEGIFNHFKLNTRNSNWIYDGVLPEKNTNFVASKEKYFLFVGNITQNKGVSELIDAFIQFSEYDQDFELRIIGKANENSYMRSLILKVRENGLENRIKFLGYCNNVHAYMSTATALIVPSEFEGFGFITAEAMFNGCLVIGKNTGGTKEQFDNGLKYTGSEIAVRYSTIKDLETIMKQIKFKGIEAYFKMIKDAQLVVTNLYTIEQNTIKIKGVYDQLSLNRLTERN